MKKTYTIKELKQALRNPKLEVYIASNYYGYSNDFDKVIALEYYQPGEIQSNDETEETGGWFFEYEEWDALCELKHASDIFIRQDTPIKVKIPKG